MESEFKKCEMNHFTDSLVSDSVKLYLFKVEADLVWAFLAISDCCPYLFTTPLNF